MKGKLHDILKIAEHLALERNKNEIHEENLEKKLQKPAIADLWRDSRDYTICRFREDVGWRSNCGNEKIWHRMRCLTIPFRFV